MLPLSIRIYWTYMVVSFFLPALLFAAEPSGQGSHSQDRVSELVTLLQQTYDGLEDVMAQFEQRTFAPGDDKGVYARGWVWFKRPEKMRWEYEVPEKKSIVTSGEDVYIYEKEVDQVTVVPRDRFLNSEISKAFFCGRGRLTAFFEVSLACPEAGKECWSLRLVPLKEAPNLKELEIGIDPESGLIDRVVVVQTLGGRSVISFHGMKTNTGLEDGMFDFKIPADAEVYRLD